MGLLPQLSLIQSTMPEPMLLQPLLILSSTDQLQHIPTPSQFQPTLKLSMQVLTLTPTPSHMFWELEHQSLDTFQLLLLPPSQLKLKPKPLLPPNRLPEENETKIYKNIIISMGKEV